MRWLLIAGAVSLLGLTGCSSVKEELKPAKLEKIEPAATLSRLWSRGIGKVERTGQLQPLLLNDVLYVVDSRGRVTALETQSGNRRWERSLAVKTGGGLGEGGGHLLLGTLDGDVVALDPADGNELWRTELDTEVLAAPQGNDEIIIVSAINGKVTALAAATGEPLWSYNHALPILTLRANATPLVTEDAAYVGFDNGQLVSFEPQQGTLRWTVRVAQPRGKTEIERLVDIDSRPVMDGALVFAGAVNGRLMAVNVATGRVNWAQDISTFQDIALEDGRLAVVTEDSQVKLFEAQTGTLLWESRALYRRQLSAPVFFEGMLVTLDYEGILHGFALEDGALIARKKVGDPVRGRPLVQDGKLFVLLESGKLLALQLRTGTDRSMPQQTPDSGDSDAD